MHRKPVLAAVPGEVAGGGAEFGGGAGATVAAVVDAVERLGR